MANISTDKYAGGGKMWVPQRLAKEKSFWVSIANPLSAGALLFTTFTIMVVVTLSAGANIGITVPITTSDLQVRINTSSLAFNLPAIIAVVAAGFSGIWSIFSVNPLVSKSRKVRVFKRVSRLLFVPIITVALVLGSSTYLPQGDSTLKERTATYIKLWASGEDVFMTRTQATELTNFVWSQKPNADERSPKDSKPYTFSVKTDGKTKDIFVYKIEKNDILFSIKK